MAQNNRLFSNWFSDPDKQQPMTAQELNKFNYNDEQDKIKRKRAISDMLIKQGQQQQQGQFIKNGDFIGYAGGNTLGSALMQGLLTYMGMKGDEQATADQSAMQDNRMAATKLQADFQAGKVDENGNPIDWTGKAQDMLNERAPYRIETESQTGLKADPSALSTDLSIATANKQGLQAKPEDLPTFSTDTQAAPVVAPVAAPATTPVVAAPVKTKVAAKAVAAGTPAPARYNPAVDSQVASNALRTEDANGYLPNEGILDRAGRRTKAILRAIAMDPTDPNAARPYGTPTGVNTPPAGNTGGATGSWEDAKPTPSTPIGKAAQVSTPVVAATTPVATQPTAPVTPPVATPDPQATLKAGAFTNRAEKAGPVEAAYLQSQTAAERSSDVNNWIKYGQLGPEQSAIAQAEIAKIIGPKSHKWTLNSDTGIMYDESVGPGSVVRVGQGGGKVLDQDLKYRELVDPTNPQAVNAYNEWRVSQGMKPLAADTIAGSNMNSGTRGTQAREGRAEQDRTAARDQQFNNATGDINAVTRQIDSLLAPHKEGGSVVSRALGATNNWYDKVTGALNIPTEVSATRADIDSLKSGLMLQAMSSLKSVGNGSTGMGGISDAEGAALKNKIAALDYNKMGAQQFERSLLEIKGELQRLAQRNEEARKGYSGASPAASGATRAPGTAGQRLSISQF